MEFGYASDQMHNFDAPIGILVVCAAPVESRAIWAATRENVTLTLPPDSFSYLAEQELDVGWVNLDPIPFGTIDRKAGSGATSEYGQEGLNLVRIRLSGKPLELLSER
jgi:hypothetical protein